VVAASAGGLKANLPISRGPIATGLILLAGMKPRCQVSERETDSAGATGLTVPREWSCSLERAGETADPLP
jgi:hypothetical protein